MSVNSSTSSSNQGLGARHHLVALGAGILLLLGCVAAVDLLVDPYRMFGSPDRPGFNAVKPDFSEHLRLTTPYALERARPEVLFLGTSRVGRGLAPADLALAGRPAYNAALPAVSVYEAWRTLQHAAAVGPLRVVVLGLDNRMFYADTDGQGTFSEARMAVAASGQRQRNPFAARLPDQVASLLSTDALLSSARTIRYQRWAKLTLAADGHWSAVNGGSEAFRGFRLMTRNTFDRYRRYAGERFDMQRSSVPLREMLRFCHRRSIDLRMFVPPAHAWHWEAMRLMGMTARFDDIRREMVRVNHEVALELGREPFPLVDFSGYVGPNTEPAPASAAASSPWFFETVHFSPQLGARILTRLFEHGRLAPEYGRSIDVTNIEAHLTEWHAERDRYAAAMPSEVREVAALFDDWSRHDPNRAAAPSR